MSHTCTNLVVHIIFSTKDRVPQIRPEIRERLHGYIGGIIREIGGKALIINGPADHVHALVRLPAIVSVAAAVRTIKTNSSRWVHETWPKCTFAWQSGYAAFTVSQSSISRVAEYIGSQERHHQRRDFRAELMEFIRANGIEVDERYLWN